MSELRKSLVIGGERYNLAVGQAGEGPPGENTPGKAGVTYLDTAAQPPVLYVCTAAVKSGEQIKCTWVQVGGAGSGSGENPNLDSLDLKLYNGKLYITVNGVRTGNGVTIGTAFYDVVLNLTNCISSNDATIAEEHSEYTTVVSAKTGFVMNQLSVTMGGVALTPDNGEIHIQDVTGEIQITAVAVETADSIDVSGIVAWYQDEVIEGYNYVKELSNADGNWVHHVVLTDTHFAHNAGNSVPICNLLMSTGRFDKFIHLGDIVDTPSESNWQAALDAGITQYANKMLFCIGNHDDEGTEVTNQTYYDALIAPNASLVMGSEDVTNLYYYCDDTPRKIRYIVLNSMLNANDEMRTWLDDRIGELDEKWVYFILEHYPAYNPLNGSVGCADIYLKIDSILARATCGGHIAGHNHADYCGNNEFYNQQTYLEDKLLYGETDFPDGRVSVREPGTASEHAITILSINPATRDVRSYRIGAHADGYQLMTYNYGTLRDDKTPIASYFTAAVSPGVITHNDEAKAMSKDCYTANGDDVDSDYYVMFRNDFAATPAYEIFLSQYSEQKATSWLGRNKFSPKDTRINKAFGYVTPIKRNYSAARYMLMSFTLNEGTSVDECTITKEYTPSIPYSTDMWESGWLDNKNISDDTGGIAYVTGKAFSVKPNTKYRLRNTEPDWTMSYIRALQFSRYFVDSQVTMSPSGTISASEYSFTTKAATNYIVLGFKTSGEPHLDTIVFEEVVE